MYKHILIPTDGSPQSAKAITGAVELAKAIGAKVTGLFAAPPATPIFYRDHLPAGFGTMEDHKRIIEDSAARYLDVVAQAAKQAGVPCEVITVTSDYPADTILETATEKKLRSHRDGDPWPPRHQRRPARQRDAAGRDPRQDSGAGLSVARNGLNSCIG